MNEPDRASAKDPLHRDTPSAETPHHPQAVHVEYGRAPSVQRSIRRQNSFEVLAHKKSQFPAAPKPLLALAGWPLQPYPDPTTIGHALLQNDPDPIAGLPAAAALSEVAVP